MPYTTSRGPHTNAVIDLNALGRDNGAQMDFTTVTATDAAGRKTVPAFTACGIVAGKLVPRSGTVAATVILLTDATDGVSTDSASGYGYANAGGFYETLMPQFAASGAGATTWGTVKTELGARFWFRPYSDSRAA